MAVSLSISIAQNSQSIDNNTSNVTVKVNIKWTYGSFNRTEKNGYLIIDGTKYTFSSTFNENESTSGSQTIFTKTVNVPHNSDGSKTLACSASFTSGVSSGTVTATASKVLTTIPRKSTLSASNGTLGTAQTLTVTRKSSNFTHTITYKCGSASGTVVSKSNDTSVSFTPPLSLAAQNTTGTSVSITFTITTFNYSTGATIGSSTKTISCAIPASVKPSCTVSVTDAAGYESTYGNPIKGLSKLKVTVSPTIAQGSPIASYSTKANGSTYTAATFTTDVLKSSGTMTISATVKDKRGRSGTASASKTVLDYTEPVIAALTVIRCNSDGTENNQGEFVQAKFTATVTPLNSKNKAVYKIGYKKTSESTYTETTLTAINNVFSVSNQTFIFPADSSNSYDVLLTVTDNFKSMSRHTSASTGFTLMHFGADGKSIGMGKLAEYPLDIGLDTRFNSPVSGKVMGLDKLPAIPADSDLNNYMETGCYAVHSNATAATIANIPVERAGRLEVVSSTGEGIRVTEWSYIRQRFTPYNADNAVWERDITRSADNVWRYYDWYRSTLSKAKSEEIYHGQKVLWGADMASGMYMTNGHTATLAEKVSEQPNGIVLVFCYYNGTSDTNWGFQSFFVPKQLVSLEPGDGHTFQLTNGKYGTVGTKYLYINDDKIVGHVDNNASGTAGTGITFNNAKFVMRYVIGV
jgi:hypothetical protein